MHRNSIWRFLRYVFGVICSLWLFACSEPTNNSDDVDAGDQTEKREDTYTESHEVNETDDTDTDVETTSENIDGTDDTDTVDTLLEEVSACMDVSGNSIPLTAEQTEDGRFLLPVPALLELSDISAKQVWEDGAPIRAMRLTVPLRCVETQLENPDEMEIEVQALDPITDTLASIILPVESAAIKDNELILRVAGPISNGAVWYLPEGVLRVGGVDSAEARGTISGAMDGQEAATWFRPFTPTEPELLNRSYHNGTSPDIDLAPQAADAASLRETLGLLYNSLIQAEMLSTEESEKWLTYFDDAVLGERSSVADIVTDDVGEPQWQLLASLLSVAGTLADGLLDDVLPADEEAAWVKIVWDGAFGLSLPEKASGMAWFDEEGGLFVILNRRLEQSPFVVATPTIAHEFIHQDKGVGKEEEVVAATVETLVWAQLLLASPSLVTIKTPESRATNTKVLAFLNSGAAAYPRAGIMTPPGVGDDYTIIPGSSYGTVRSFNALVGDILYADLASSTTGGSDYLDRVVQGMTGQAYVGLDFNAQTLSALDSMTILTPEQQYRLMQTLRLTWE